MRIRSVLRDKFQLLQPTDPENYPHFSLTSLEAMLVSVHRLLDQIKSMKNIHLSFYGVSLVRSLGKSVHSLMLFCLVIAIVSLCGPIAQPACGGAPDLKALI